ncbi:MAG: PAC2 family protein [Candidatus Woesearchaeota archaeon]|nr:MAG: PAC2 family protein [Candidatus Woesearchaeota archaeon]
MSSWIIKQQKAISIKNGIFIEGLPGIGNVGKIVVDFIIEQTNAEKIYDLFSYDLPNSVFVNEDNLVELPKIEVYYKKIGTNEFVFLSGDVQPSDERASYEFSEELIKLIKKTKCTKIITLGGIGMNEIPKQPRVFVTGSDEALRDSFTKAGADKNLFGVVGPVIGVTGLLLGLGKQENIPSAALLAQTYAHPIYLGLNGAKKIIKLLMKTYNIDLDLKELNKEIKTFENNLLTGGEPHLRSVKNIKKLNDTTYIG